MDTINIPWSLREKLVFRFFCCFLIIYIFPFPFSLLENILPFVFENPPKYMKCYTTFLGYYDSFNHAYIPWLGAHVFRLAKPITIFTNGSGDTTYDYIALLTFFLLSVIATVVWTLLDRKRLNYAGAYYWLRVLVRYFLALTMLIYGFSKVFHLQM